MKTSPFQKVVILAAVTAVALPLAAVAHPPQGRSSPGSGPERYCEFPDHPQWSYRHESCYAGPMVVYSAPMYAVPAPVVYPPPPPPPVVYVPAPPPPPPIIYYPFNPGISLVFHF